MNALKPRGIWTMVYDENRPQPVTFFPPASDGAEQPVLQSVPAAARLKTIIHLHSLVFNHMISQSVENSIILLIIRTVDLTSQLNQQIFRQWPVQVGQMGSTPAWGGNGNSRHVPCSKPGLHCHITILIVINIIDIHHHQYHHHHNLLI